MHRYRSCRAAAWIISVVFISLLAFQFQGTFAHRDDDYAFVRALVDINRQVAAHYVDPVDDEKLRQAAIDGMLEELDPFSVYVPPRKQEEFDRMLEGTFKGVGIQLDQEDDGDIRVVSPIDGSPAFKAGLSVSDTILAVNGIAYDADRLKEAITAVKDGKEPISFIVKDGDHYRTVQIDYHGGLRYPRLERVAGAPDLLSEIYRPLK